MKKREAEVLTIPKIEIGTVRIKVRGTTPLIVNNFSEKSKQQMLDKQMKKANTGREVKDPQDQYERSLYKFSDGIRTGFPAVGFKAAMVRASTHLGMKMINMQCLIHVMADEGDLVEIKGEYHIREDIVRVANGAPDVRFRAEYSAGWKAELVINYLLNNISPEQIAQLVVMAGFTCGIGEWRPGRAKTGNFGLFELNYD